MEDAEDKVAESTKEGLRIIQEGAAVLSIEAASQSFYNPIQQFNRDLTVTVLQQFMEDRLKERADKKEANPETTEPIAKKKKFHIEDEDGSIRILDALSATGLRAIRFAKEVSNVKSVVANDFSEEAVETIKKNILLNGLQEKVTAHYGDAVMTMMSNRGIDKRFHVVDLDPYGSASVFLDSAVQCVADRGILMVTCTDMAVLCGNTPESTYNKYDSIPLRTKSCHEMVDFYVRVFVRMHTGAKQAKDSAKNSSRLLVCSGCHSIEVLPLVRKTQEGSSLRYTPALADCSLVKDGNKCVYCQRSVHQGGPIYSSSLHDKSFVQRLIKRLENTAEAERLGTHRRLLGVLSVVGEELDTPLYYLHDALCSVTKCTVPKILAFRSAILNAGYEVSGSHCHPRAVKTNAPTELLWDICRSIARDSSVSLKKFEEGSAGRVILEKEIQQTINFASHPRAVSLAKRDCLVRFQCNKGLNWGPKSKAKGSVNSVKAGFQVEKQNIPEEN